MQEGLWDEPGSWAGLARQREPALGTGSWSGKRIKGFCLGFAPSVSLLRGLSWGWKHLLSVVLKYLPTGWNGLGSVIGLDLVLCSEAGPDHNLWIQQPKLKNMH